MDPIGRSFSTFCKIILAIFNQPFCTKKITKRSVIRIHNRDANAGVSGIDGKLKDNPALNHPKHRLITCRETS